MGQLPFQIVHSVRIMILLRSALAVALAIEPSFAGVKLAEPKRFRFANDNVIGRYYIENTGLTL